MSDLLETLKSLIGLTSTDYDFIIVIFIMLFVLLFFNNLLGLFGSLFNWVGGKR